jgi:hypothetical protein
MARRKQHGMTGTDTYGSWAAMIRRTTENQKSRYFIDYAGRGIRVCERWKDFRNFYEDMGDRPSKNHSLGRKDNDRGYELDNCLWQTKRQQQRDRRSVRKYEAIRSIRRTTGKQDLTLRQVAHKALASLRTIPTQGANARTPEDIIAAFVVWLDKQRPDTQPPGAARSKRKQSKAGLSHKEVSERMARVLPDVANMTEDERRSLL